MENECADHAASLGAFGFVSDHNVNARSLHSSFQIANFARECNNLEEIQHCPSETPAQQTRAVTWQDVPHPASLLSHCVP